jgi:hypothetical protein
MTPSERFAAIIAALTLVFLVMTTGLGLIVRITMRWAKIESNLQSITEKVSELVDGKRTDHLYLDSRIDKVDSRIERHEQWHRDRGQ